jgi:hypothetical protein
VWLLGYEPSIVAGAKFRLHQTKHPNALPASWHLSLVNGGEARGLFHPR